MPDYLFLLHNDTTQPVTTAGWDPYFVTLPVYEAGGPVEIRKLPRTC
jgi:hypothetical protein